MSNHVHLIAVPEMQTSLAKGIGEAHKRYSRMVNFREGWRGYLFQGRFLSFPLDGGHVIAAVRYVLRNPVRAGIVMKPSSYRWSSAKWLAGKESDDPLAEEPRSCRRSTTGKLFYPTTLSKMNSSADTHGLDALLAVSPS